MAAPYQAVILAAGRGSRLHEHTHEIPKALLPIGTHAVHDKTETNFLRQQVELLHGLGVGQIVIVVGCLREQVIAAVARWDVPVQLVVNPTPDIGTSGSLHSFQFAVRAGIGVLDGRMQTLLLDADIVYHRDALRRLLDASERSALLVCDLERIDERLREARCSSRRPVQIVYALEQALSKCFAEGAETRHRRYVANWEVLDGGMLALGFRGLLPEAILSRILTCYLEPDYPRYDFGEMHDRLYARGFTIYPGKGANKATFRLANMGGVDTDDMRAFLDAMRETISR